MATMPLDSLTRLVASADFSIFRDVAFEYLRLRGFKEIALRDGWGDGGSDFGVAGSSRAGGALGIQVTVQRRDWEHKLKADALKANEAFDTRAFLYVTSRRLPPVLIASIQDDLRDNHGISLQTADSQSIASTFYEHASTTRLLKLFGIEGSRSQGRREGFGSPLRLDAAYAFAFFGESSVSFKDEVIEHAVLAALTSPQATDGSRASVVRASLELLNLEQSQARLVESGVDRMLQRGRLGLVAGTLEPSAELADAVVAARALRSRRWGELQERLVQQITAHGLRGRALETALEAAKVASGALVLSGAASAEGALTHKDLGPAQRQAWRGLRELSASLMAAGLDPSDAATLVQALTETVVSADISQQLMAGELFVSLTRLDTPYLLQALGGAGGLDVYLDASVAMPMLASLYYEAGSQRYFRAASVAYEALIRGEISLVLPVDYLEEAASHLITAEAHYAPLVGRDPDLRLSTNAFVAHYVDLLERGVMPTDFASYVGSFGLRRPDLTFHQKRREVMRVMEGLLGRYGIRVSKLPVSDDVLRDAETAIAFKAQELSLERPSRLLRHDARTVAFLAGLNPRSGKSALLCTWDGLHLQLDPPQGTSVFAALDPAMLADLLSLATTQEGHLMSGTILALELSEQASQQGADVLDAIVRLEGGSLHDAELLRRAEQFKSSYLEKLRSGARPDDLARAWAESKNEDESL